MVALKEMEGCMLQPRDVVLQYGVLPPSVFAPQLDSVASVQAVHRSLAAAATATSDGRKYVSCTAVAPVLEMPAEQCQLLLDMVAAVTDKPSNDAEGVDLYDLSLLLMFQLYKRETLKPETQDHWPETNSSGSGAPDALKSSARTSQPGSPGGANNSRTLVKNQIQQQQRQQQACSRGYADFLQKHQIALLELVMDDSSTAEAWQQQRTAHIQQQKAAQLQLHEPQQQHSPQVQTAAMSEQQQEQQHQLQQGQQAVAGDETEMTPAEDVAAEPAAATEGAQEDADEPMQSSPVRQTSDNSEHVLQQQQLLMRSSGSVGSLGRSSNSAIPPVAVTAAEYDRLGFLLEVVPVGHRSLAGTSSSGGGLAAQFAAAAGNAAPAGDQPCSSSSRLSHCVPGYSASTSLMMDDLVSWMNNSWVQVQQQKLAAQNSLVPAAASAADPAAAAAGEAPGGSGLAAGLSVSPPSDNLMMMLGSSPPSSSLLGAAGAANLGINGLLPAINTGTGAAASPVTPSAGSSAAAAVGGLSGLGSIRINTARGVVAVASGTVDDSGVSGVYRGTVVRGPNDVTRDELTIQNCIECHIYILAPVKLARITNCTDCTVCIGAAGTLLRIDCCERLQLTAAAGQVVVVSCHSCCLHLGTPRPPALIGDCRLVKLAPYNTRYETLLTHLEAAGIPAGQPSLWDQPIVISCTTSSSTGTSIGGAISSKSEGGSSSTTAAQLQQQRRPGASTPSSPHTHGSSGGSSERRGGAAAAARPALLMQPEEFLPLVVPFRGTSGPLAGGAAHSASTHWLPGSHKQQQGPLPPFPFTLPEPFDSALQQQYSVVTELRNRIRNSGLDEGRRNQLQGVIQSYFREWLHSSGAIRQVYDLSKLEGDEYGPSGGSPPAALRDHTQL